MRDRFDTRATETIDHRQKKRILIMIIITISVSPVICCFFAGKRKEDVGGNKFKLTR
jgi:hypothetical protein